MKNQFPTQRDHPLDMEDFYLPGNEHDGDARPLDSGWCHRGHYYMVDPLFPGCTLCHG